ncbi:unnamed protein product [Dicrocoelium dendriticum]|nr:unnamed protein product [Dicrocoelium dendriticum]
MAVGRTADGLPAFAPLRRGVRGTYTPSIISEPVESEPFEVPSARVPPLRLTGDLLVEPVSRPTHTPSVTLTWTPIKEKITGYSVDLFDFDTSAGWRTVARVPSEEAQAPFSGVTISGLIPGHSYRFRVLPYRDDTYGQPLQSTQLYTAPKLLIDTQEMMYDRIQLPAPHGPLRVDRLSSDLYRLSWYMPRILTELSSTQRYKLEDEIEFVIEQRLPHKRMWYEVGRTRALHYLLPLDTTSQFRVRTVLMRATESDLERKYAPSHEGLLSDWITVPYEDRALERQLEVISPRRYDSRGRRVSVDVGLELGRFVPDRLSAVHIGRSTVLLEWLSMEVPQQDGDRYLLLEKRSPEDGLGVWEPVARLPLSSTGYEVHGLRPGMTYDFRLVEWDADLRTRSIKTAQLSAPVTTAGTKRSLEELITRLVPPEHFKALVKTDSTGEGIRFTWLPPEVPEHARPSIRYRIEARSVDSEGKGLSDWTTVASSIFGTEHFIPLDKLTDLTLEAKDAETYDTRGDTRRRRRRPSSPKEAQRRHWQFRAFTLLDEATSLPVQIPEIVSLVPPIRRKPLRFLNLKDDRIIYSVLGQRLTVTVEVEGEPAPYLTWFLNNIRLDDRFSTGYTAGQVGVGVYEFTIERIERSHAGLLECRAWNAYETIHTSWQIIVCAVPRFTRFGWTTEPREFELKHGDRWEFRIPLDNSGYYSGHEWITKVWLERLTLALPSMDIPDVSEPLEARARLVFSGDCQWVELTVDRVTLADAGVYRLWVQNQAGQDYVDLRLRVADKPHIRPNKPRVLPHGPGTLAIHWDISMPTNRLEAEVQYTGYRVEYQRDAPDAPWCLLGTTPADTMQLIARSPLQPGVTYRFRVCMVNWHGFGPFSQSSDPARLPSSGLTETFDVTDDAVYFADGSFEDRYSITRELARTKYAGLYRVFEKSTGRHWLGKVVDTDVGSTERIYSSALVDGLDGMHKRSYSSQSVKLPDINGYDERRTSVTSLIESAQWRRERTEQELKLLSRIQHEGMAKFHEAYQDARRTIALVEDITAGGSLWHQLSRRITVTENKAAEILRQLLDLTNQMHQSGVVNLGLQPENIFFTDQTKRRVALAGLGQPQQLDEEQRPVRLTFRSAVYLPPELQAEPTRRGRIGPATDLWSLGVLLYQMTTGDFEGPPEVSRMEKMQLSPKMVRFTKRLLHPDPTKRPTAAEALRDPWFTIVKSQLELRRPASPVPVRRPPSAIDGLVRDESVDRDVYESISKQAYTRLLRWIDASHMEDELDEAVKPHELRRRTSHRQIHGVDRSQTDSQRDIVVHATVAPRGQAPEILTPMGSVSVEEGSPATLKCAVHLPRPKKPVAPLDRMSDLIIQWSLNGRELKLAPPTVKLRQPPSMHYTCTYDPETGDVRLHIDEVTTYDAGTYEVKVTGLYGSVSDSANIRVYAAPHRPESRTESYEAEELGARIVQPLVDMTAISGQKVQLRARVSGIPLPRCTWLHNGVPLVNSTKRRFYQDEIGRTHNSELQLTLEILNLAVSDAGLYTLVATNKHGSQSCSAIVDVLSTLDGDHEAPRFLVELSSVTVVEGSAARFEACVQGKPPATVRWLKDGKPLLTDGIRLTVSQSSAEPSDMNITSHTLLVRDALLRDSGTYTCIATSSSGTAITEAALHVRGLFNRGMSFGPDMAGVAIRHRQPEFTRRLRNQQVALGGTIRLAASVLAQPTATVIWNRNGTEIDADSDPRVTIKNQSGHLELCIDDITKEDLGQYTVVVFNSAGEARCSCAVTILEEKYFRLPQFTKELRNQTVVEGTTLCLEATATGLPMPDFKWEKDGFELLSTESGKQRIVSSSTGDGTACLKISNLRTSDAGLYRCIAHNRYGRERSTAFVYVVTLAQRSSIDRSTYARGMSAGRELSIPPTSSSLDVSNSAIPQLSQDGLPGIGRTTSIIPQYIHLH